jgi:fructokinase
MLNVVAIGELLIDFIPQQAGTGVQQADSFRKAAGGAPANVAVGAARLGSRSAFIGKAGADPFGRYLKGVLQDNNVDTRGLLLDPLGQTSLAFVSLATDGDRDFTFYRRSGADTRLEESELDAELLRSAGFLHCCSISLTDEPARSATFAAVDIAAEAGAQISFDVNLRLPLWNGADEARRQIRRMRELANIVKLSSEELEFLAGSSDPGRMAQLFTPAMQLLIVSAGASGVHYLTGYCSGHVPGFTVRTVDTTGAGDALAAAVLHELARQPDLLAIPAADPAAGRAAEERLREVLLRANAYAALSTTRPGAIPSLPTAVELAAFLALAGFAGASVT